MLRQRNLCKRHDGKQCKSCQAFTLRASKAEEIYINKLKSREIIRSQHSCKMKSDSDRFI